MDNPGLGRIHRFFLLFSSLLFIALLVHSLIAVPPDLDPRFHWAYAWRLAGLHLVDVLLPVQLSAVLLVSSLLYRKGGKATPSPAFHALAAPALPRFLLTTAVYAALVLGICPAMRSRLADLQWRSREGRQLQERMEAERARGEYELAVLLGERAVELLGEDRKLLGALDGLRLAAAEERGRKERPPEARPAAARSEGLTYLEMVRRGEEYLRQEDAFTAYYYALLAQKLEAHRREARNLASAAEERIASLQPGPREERASALFKRKREGWEALTRDNPIAAYAIFRELSEQMPGDAEVAFFLGESRKRMQSMAFFLEEAELAFLYPGPGGLFFLNERGEDLREVVAIGQVALAPGGTFCRGVEVAGLRPDGRLLYHLRAPYGKLIEGHLALEGVSRHDGSRRAGPRFVAGSLPRDRGPLLPLRPPEAVWPFFQTGGVDLSAARLISLWQARPQLERYGWSAEPVAMEILSRLTAPLAFLICSLLALALGWSGRWRAGGRPPAGTWLLALAIPAAALLGARLATTGQRLLAGVLLPAAGFLPALLVLLFLHLVLLCAALVLLAGQRAG